MTNIDINEVYVVQSGIPVPHRHQLRIDRARGFGRPARMLALFDAMHYDQTALFANRWRGTFDTTVDRIHQSEPRDYRLRAFTTGDGHFRVYKLPPNNDVTHDFED